jgi:hypothetical protein
METIKVKGDAKAGGLLPAYYVDMQLLDTDETIQDNDVMLFGSNPNAYGDWTSIKGSSFVGRSVADVCMEFNKRITFGRI